MKRVGPGEVFDEGAGIIGFDRKKAIDELARCGDDGEGDEFAPLIGQIDEQRGQGASSAAAGNQDKEL